MKFARILKSRMKNFEILFCVKANIRISAPFIHTKNI